MPKAIIKEIGWKCCRCNHKWKPKKKKSSMVKEKPITCPKCRSPYWDIPKREVSKK